MAISLKEAIKKAHLSQKGLALEAGIKPDFMNQIVLGKRKPTESVSKILNKYNLLANMINSEKPELTSAKDKSTHPKRHYQDLYDKWIEQKTYEGSSTRTLEGYAESLKPILKALDLNTASKDDIQRYINSKMRKKPEDRFGWNEVSANRHLKEIQAFTNWLEDEELITPNENVARKVPFKHEPTRNKPTMLVGTFKELYSADTDTQHRLVETLAYETGMRKRELANILLADIDKVNRTIKTIGKRNKELHPKYDKASEDLMVKWLAEKKGYTWVKGQKGQPAKKVDRSKHLFDMGYSGIGSFTTRLGKKLGKHVNPHTFRRGLTFSLLQSGLDIKKVKEIIGHEDIKTTIKYANELDQPKAQESYISPLAGLFGND